MKSKYDIQIQLCQVFDNNKEQLINTRSIDVEIQTELSEIMGELSSKSLDMFKSYGINYSDIGQYVDDRNDPRIGVMGMVFLHLLEQNKVPQNNIVRLRSSSPEEQEFSYGQVMDCLGRVLLGAEIGEIFAGGAAKITLKGALSIAGRVAARTLGVAAAAVAVVDFGDCMGLYNIW
ncbi:MAG TPA: hypothetical protein DDZ96_05415 [Porphyromonadaceae bacterium]|jgi:hypothetical protein|nr:hypothetical protein [Porphyromonadaceae bacterium]HBL33243.1 hypothetical protein [Porphyromonadaceae bacterium]HBX21517.1 hypothetical protein [Porphyromonadaceae bacterium]HCM19919.1 hypothetical protein [Porphyromonadaceae bacterium]